MTSLGTSNRFANHLDVHFLKKGEKAGSFHFLLGRQADSQIVGVLVLLVDGLVVGLTYCVVPFSF